MKAVSDRVERLGLVGSSHGCARAHGFTLVELMVVLAVIAILAAIAIPQMNDSTLGSKLRAQANDLSMGAVLARSEAIKRNQVVNLCASSDGSSCSGGWADGWIVVSSDGTVIQSHPAAATGFVIDADATNIAFQPSGVGSTATALTICRQSPTAGSQERVVSISATGRASVAKTAAGSCP
ncbi:GspH/FimT family pseudopilin [Pseudomonas sp. N040]|uniref:GspH/FimT family pseudopilin n=1 Tax=Pseudomonas sp. N040 TaxID=2785325 RepID=UPI0018A28F2D|nr:GspH/FimT family protein [Pseudomonas sp. N040]MBF7730245.1 GspH/FimT family pseudopilin [Pseudomonas sp. N040]MBW7013887.1 GspH/FimT family pseudopilin [Pseudomonas sp. N040]